MPDTGTTARRNPAAMARLLEIMAALRAPETGCPWDLEQDFASIAPYTIEEAYEVADAIKRGDVPGLCDELGDLLLQIVFHAQIATERGAFTFDDVARAICAKMIRRHPHVFGDETGTLKSPGDVKKTWEQIKAEERSAKRAHSGNAPARASTLDGVAQALPALMRAEKLQKRAARAGFDWPDASPVIEKMAEEVDELAEAAQSGSPDKMAEEFGDFLFAAVNFARHLGIDPEQALRGANGKFHRRFTGVEQKLAARGKTPEQSSLREMDALWNEIKAEES